MANRSPIRTALFALVCLAGIAGGPYYRPQTIKLTTPAEGKWRLRMVLDKYRAPTADVPNPNAQKGILVIRVAAADGSVSDKNITLPRATEDQGIVLAAGKTFTLSAEPGVSNTLDMQFVLEDAQGNGRSYTLGWSGIDDEDKVKVALTPVGYQKNKDKPPAEDGMGSVITEKGDSIEIRKPAFPLASR